MALQHHPPPARVQVLMGFQNIDVVKAGLSEAKHLVLPGGAMSAHSGFTVHGSPPNRSAERRRSGFSAQYIPAYVRLGADEYETLPTTHERQGDWRQPVLVRGRDDFKLNEGKLRAAPAFAAASGLGSAKL